jgi:thiamine transporter
MFKNTKELFEISVLVAISFILDMTGNIYFGWFWIYGGSVSLSLVPLAIIGYRYGWLKAVLGGMVMGILQLFFGAYIIHPAQVILDYPLAFGLLGLAGLWIKQVNSSKHWIFYIWLSTLVGSIGRLLSHVLSGYIFWADGEVGVAVWIFSFGYNTPYVAASFVLSAIVLTLIYKRYCKVFSRTEEMNFLAKGERA